MAARTTFCKGSMLPPLIYAKVGHPPGMPTHYFFSTASESSLPGEKRTRSFAGTSIGLRSSGLTPLRSALLITLKEQKPTTRTSLPSLRDLRVITSVSNKHLLALYMVFPLCTVMLLVYSHV